MISSWFNDGNPWRKKFDYILHCLGISQYVDNATINCYNTGGILFLNIKKILDKYDTFMFLLFDQ